MIDKNDYDYEVYEIFQDQFTDNMVRIKNIIFELEDSASYQQAVHDLFRIFHGMKANSLYFNFEPISVVADKVEKVLSSLRDESGPANENIIEWLLKIEKQCLIWNEEMESSAKEFSKADPLLLQSINLSSTNESASSVLKKLSVIYFDENKTRAEMLVSALQKISSSVKHIDKIDEFEKVLINEKPNICMVNIGDRCVEAAKLCKKYSPSSALIVVLDASDKKTSLKFSVHEIYHFITNPIRKEALQRELLAVTNSHFTSRRYLIDNKKIKSFIDTLQPLPTSVMQIQQICNDDELSIKDLIPVVKSDPIISGMILKATKNPMYGLKEITTIDRAIPIFGKRTVQAIALSTMVDEFGELDISAYNMTDTIFSNVAALRLTLMIKWYSKVSISALSILSTTAILGNIGQLLIAQEVVNLNMKENFLNSLHVNGIQYTEEKFMHTTTAYVSSDILSYWKLDKAVIDSVRFSDDPQNASDDIYELTLANHIVYKLIGLDGKIEPAIPENIQKLLLAKEMNLEPLQKALDYIIELSNK